MTDTPTSLDALEALLAKATPGEWAYRPDEYDDWGVIKSAPREVGRYDPPLILRGWIGQIKDPDVADEAVLVEHRLAGTDPWEANAAMIVALHNAAPDLIAKARRVEELEAALRKIAAECRVPLGADKQMYARWRQLAADRVDIARAALKENTDG